MKRHWGVALAGVISLLVVTSGCASSSDSTADTPETVTGVVTITNESLAAPSPMTVELSADAPTRIVSLATGVGETLAALGVADRVVGQDETSGNEGVDVVTKAHEVSAERVLSLNPDLVITDARTGPPEAIDQIRQAGVRVVEVPEAWTLADIGPRSQAVADAVGITNFDVDAYLDQTGADPAAVSGLTGLRVAFLYLRGTSAIYLLGGAGSGADALITAAGGVDVGAEAGLDAFTPLTAESLASLNPDVILVMTKGLESVGGIDGLVELPGVAQTNAGRNRDVIAVDDTVLLSFGPRTGALVNSLRDALQSTSAN